jgi:molybdopterin-guanine dinucleotide biosynthesis protein A
MTLKPEPDVAGFVLAGGKSSRMGRDKALIDFAGESLLSHAMETVRAVCHKSFVVGDPTKYSSYGPIVEDIYKDQGPLGGIHAALTFSAAELNLIVAVDMPLITAELLQFLIAQARASPATICVPEIDGRLQPLCAIYRREFSSVAQAALKAQENKIGRLLKPERTYVVKKDILTQAGFSVNMFTNLNSPDDLPASERKTNDYYRN